MNPLYSSQNDCYCSRSLNDNKSRSFKKQRSGIILVIRFIPVLFTLVFILGFDSIVIAGRAPASSIVNNRYSVASADWGNASTWAASSGGSPGAGVPGPNDNVFIDPGDTVTVNQSIAAIALTINANGNLVVNTAFSVTATTISISGTYKNNSTTPIVGAITVNGGGVYENAANLVPIPVATWNPNSLLKVTGATNAVPFLPSNSFYDIFWDCNGQTVIGPFMNASSTNVTCHDFVVNNTGSTGGILMGNGGARSLHMTGSFSVLGSINPANFIGANGTATQAIIVDGNFSIGSSGTFHSSYLAATGLTNLSVKGNWINDGIFDRGITAGNSTTFNGSAAQTISGNSVTIFKNLTLNNSGGLILNQDAKEDVLLTLSNVNSKITTGIYNFILSKSPASISGGGTGWVIGNLKKEMNSGEVTKTFEVGNGFYTPIKLDFTLAGTSVSTGGGNITASTKTAEHPNLSGTAINPSKDVNRYWSLNSNGVTWAQFCDATFQFDPTDLDLLADWTKFIVGKYNTPNWLLPTVGTRTSTSTQCKNLTSFSEFALGEPTPVSLNCPVVTNEAACQTQAAITSKFNAWLATATASGGCNTGSVTNNNTGAPLACGGTTTVTFTVTSSCESPVTCVSFFTVSDAPKVNLHCGVDKFDPYCRTNSQLNNSFANWLATTTSSGGCNVSFTNDNSGPPSICGGSTTVIFTVTSSCESPLTCSSKFTVADSPPVTLDPPAPYTVQPCNHTQAEVQVLYDSWLTEKTYGGGCNTLIISNNPPTAPLACGGSVTVTWTATSSCQSNVTASSTFTVAEDVLAFDPVQPITVACGSASTSVLSYSNGLAGPCLVSGTVLSTLSSQSPAGICGGDVTESWTFTDNCGKTITQSRIVTVSPPLLAAFDQVTPLEVDCGSESTTVLAYSNGVSGTCGISGTVLSTLSSQTPPGHCGGNITESWTFTDDCGRTISQSRIITVSPAAKAEFDAALPITVDCGNAAASLLPYSNNLTGSCGISGSATSTLGNIPNYCGGNVPESWTFTDDCARTSTRSRTITILPAAKAEFDPADPITVACGEAAVSPLKFSNGLSGNCSIEGSVNSTLSSQAPSGYCGGEITESWTYTDLCGRISSRSRTITVLPTAIAAFNTEPPLTVDCGNATTHSLHYGNGKNGSCAISGTVLSTLGNIPDYCGGDVTESWSFTDNCGRTITKTRIITVLPAAQASFEAVEPITVSCGTIGSTTHNLNYTNSASTTGCLISGSVAGTYSTEPGYCGGNVTESWSFTDNCGRTITQSRIVSVLPAAQAQFSTPSPITVSCGEASTSSLPYTNGLSGGCDISGSVTSTLSGQSPAGYCGGDITESWSFTDNCGRTSTRSRTITVLPADPAVFAVPSAITVACGQATTSLLPYSNGLGTGCDISGSATSTLSGQSPAGYCGGDITESWSFTDNCGRTITQSRNITVLPAAQAQFDTPSPITVSCGEATTSLLPYSNGLGTGCDISGSATSTLSGQTPAGYCGGDITESWSFTDNCGRTSTRSRIISVLPAAPAVFATPSAITVACGEATTSLLPYTNGLGTGCDISGSATSTLSGQSPAGYCGGDITESWSFTDNCGRTITQSRNITVLPAAQAQFDTPSAITVACGQATTSLLPYSNGLSNGCDISGSVTSTLSTQSPAGYCGGDITESWSFTDNCGRTSTRSRIITVLPAAPAVFATPSAITVACGEATTSLLPYTNGLSGGCDISGSVTSTLSGQTPAGYCGGDITESWSFTDNCGRTITQSRNITVLPTAQAEFAPALPISVGCGQLTTTPLNYSNGKNGDCAISGSVLSTLSIQSPSGYCGGSVIESWTYTDNCGRTSTRSRNITVGPAPIAVFEVPNAITVGCGEAVNVSLNYSNHLTGVCEISGSVLSTFGPQIPSGYCGGDMKEEWIFIDNCARTIIQQRVVTVLPATQAQFATPSAITVACGEATTSLLPYSNGLSGGCDISGSATSTLSTLPNNCGGVIIESWTFTDNCGRTSTRSRTITILPAAQAQFDPADPITVACGDALRSPLAYSNGLTGNCGISGTAVSTLSAQSPAGYCGGDVTETWSFTDNCGRTSTRSRIITVLPAAQAQFDTPSAITVACGEATTSALPFTNGLSGGCDISGSATSTLSGQSPAGYCGGDITESWSFTDNCGRTSTRSRNITVLPAAPAVFATPSAITVACGEATTSLLPYSNGLGNGCDISGSVTSTLSGQTPAGYCGGDITESWSFTDNCGRTITQSRNITVLPSAQAQFDTPSAITVACGQATTSLLPYSNGLSNGCDISGSATSTLSGQTPAGYCGGDITESWSFTDNCGRTSTRSRNITVLPAAQADFGPAAAITVACGQAIVSPLNYSNDIFGGTCEISGSVLSSLSTLPNNCGGDITETWTFTDNCGRTSTRSRTITILPATQAQFATPSAITVGCGEASASPLPYTNGLTGTCEISGTVNSLLGPQSPSGYCGGDITETWTFTDNCGRTSTQSRTVTVLPAAIATFETASPITVACGDAATSPLKYTNGLTGNCDITGTQTSTLGSQSPAGNCGGKITESWTFTDNCNRLSTQSRTITVLPTAQAQFDPVLPLTVNCGGASISSLHYTNGLSGSCLISGTRNSTLSTQSPTGYCGGNITESWTFTDNCGRTSTQSRIITVLPTLQTVFNAAPPLTVACGVTTHVLHHFNGRSGACEISGNVTSTLSSVPDYCGGNFTESWTFTDNCGRTSTQSRILTIQPSTQAQFLPASAITVACGAATSNVLSFTNGLSGSCQIGGTAMSTLGTQSPSGYCGGDITELWTFVDNCGRTSTRSRIVTVLPAAQAQFDTPSAITVACGEATTSSLSYTNGLGTGCDISGSATSTLSGQSPAGYCGGDITESWSFTDNCGRTSTRSRTITVLPADPAVFAVPSAITVACGQATTSLLPYSNGLGTGCDISGSATSTLSGQSPAGYCGGDITESWSFTDNCGRTITQSRNITVLPAAQAQFDTPSAITVACGEATTSLLPYSNGLGTGCDISGSATSTLSGQTPAGYCGGDITESWSFTDNCGRTSTRSRIISVLPAAPAVFATPSAITVACGEATTSLLPYTNGLGTGCDISGSATSTLSGQSPAGYCGGDITESWSFTDNCGRTITQSRNITVLPAAQAQFDTPSAITVACGQATTSLLPYSNGLSNGCDISGSVTSTLSGQSPAGYCGGDITESWSFTDNCGRTSTRSRIITVLPAAPAVFSTPSAITVACGEATTSSLPYTNGLSGGCDISGSATSTLSGQSPSGYCGGDITESWSFTDNCGRTITQSRIITVLPSAQAQFATPSAITVACGEATTSLLPYSNGLSNGCDISGSATSTLSGQTPAGYCGGDITESWSFTDNCGRTSTRSRIISVLPASPATFNNVSPITVSCGEATTSPLPYTNGLSGGCEIAGTVTSVLGPQVPSGYCGGDVKEEWTFTDNCGRTIVQQRTITVLPAAQAQFNPVLPLTVGCGDAKTSMLNYTNGKDGDCKIAGLITSTLSTQSPAGYCGGDITESWTFTDNCGRTSTQSRIISVLPSAQAQFDYAPPITVSCGTASITPLHFTNGKSGDCEISGTVNSGFETSYSSGVIDKDIPDNDALGITNTIVISGAGIINSPNDLTVGVNFTNPQDLFLGHTWSGDVEVTLTTPGGNTVVFDRPGAPVSIFGNLMDLFGQYYFNPSAGSILPQTGNALDVIANGTYKPSNSANPDAAHNWSGITFPFNPNGNWIIKVRDLHQLDVGTLHAWSLQFATGGQAPNFSCSGDITEKWSYTDNCGRVSTQSRNITVLPPAQAQFASALPISVACGEATTSLLGYSNGLNGSCEISGSVTSTLSGQSPAGYCGGGITESWSFTDNCGRTITQSRNITVLPAAQAQFDIPSAITVACGEATTSLLPYSNGLGTGCDISGSVTSTLSGQTPAGYCGGDITESWSFTDNCGRTSTRSRIISVLPASPAVFAVPSAITVACGQATTSLLPYTNGLGTGCDISGSATSTLSGQSPAGYCGGDITESWSFTDNCGRTITQSRIITVLPAAQAQFDTPSAITVACGQATTSLLPYSNGLNNGCDISGSVTSTLSTQSPAGYCGGDITESWSFTDNCGRTSTRSRIITVLPAAPAVFANPSAITVACGEATTSPLPYTNGLSGGCDISGSATSTLSSQSPAGYCGGDITESWSFTDNCGRTITQSRIITVLPAAQAQFATPSAITVACGEATTSSLPYTNGLSSGCEISGSATSTLGGQSPTGYCGGNITESWSFTDNCGRTSTRSRIITVLPTIAASFDAISPITVACGEAKIHSLHFGNGKNGTCEISGTVNSTLSTQSPSGYCGGDITESWTFTDNCGRTITQSRIITVSPTAPAVFNPASPITVGCSNVITHSLHYGNSKSGACEITGNATSTLSTQTPPGYCGGSITESWSFTDNCGRTITQSRNMTVLPVDQAQFNTVSPITVACGNATTHLLGYSNNKTSPCIISGSVTSTLSVQSPAGYCGGDITESWTFTDDCGRTSTQSRIITILPADQAVFATPSSITVACGEATTSQLPYTNGLSGGCDISGSATSILSTQSPAGYCGGDITESWSFTDNCGRTITQSRIISVLPTAQAQFATPSPITVGCGEATTSLLPYTNGLSGGCDISGSATSSLSVQSPSGYCGGNITESWTFTDNCSRTSTRSRIITVLPATPAAFNNVSPITVACGQASTSPLPFTNGLSGGCEIAGTVTSVLGPQVPPGYCGGDVKEEWTFTDNCGRTIVQQRTITVLPAAQAEFAPASPKIVACGGATTSVLPYTNGLTDGCEISGSATSTLSVQSPAGYCGGDITETWTFTDNCGRTSTRSRIITVQPAEQAQFVPAYPITVDCGTASVSPLNYSNSLSSGCEISGSVLSTLSTQSPSGYCGGDITETWTFTDNCGRTSTRSRIITVLPAPQAQYSVPVSGNILANPGFSSGNSGFSSSYTNTASNTDEGQYYVGTTPSSFNGAYYNIGDHTTGSGNMMIVNGAEFLNVNMWCQLVSVTPNTNYTFSGWLSVLVTGGPPVLQININNIQAGALQTFTDATGTWQSFSVTWNSGANTSANICIVDANPATFPNDFALDDLSFKSSFNTVISCNDAPPSGSSLDYTNGATSASCLISGSTTGVINGSHNACGGSYTETWTFVDNCSRTSTQSRTITVEPSPKAEFENALPISVACGTAATSPLNYSNASSGSCEIKGSVTSTLSAQSPPGLCGGNITESWAFTDECGRTSTKSRIITVLPSTQAQFEPAQPITVACGTASTSPLNYSNGLGVGCEISGSTTSTLSTQSPSGYCGGNITESWTFTDNCGRTSTRSRIITVLPAAQAEFSNADPITVACGAATTSPLNYTNGLSDGCEISGSVNSTLSVQSPSGYCGGNITESWTFTDDCGRTSTRSRIITVLPAAPAAFESALPITVACGNAATSPLHFTNGLSDGCEISGSVNSTLNVQSPSGYCGGNITESWSFTDNCGRTITQSRIITVSPALEAVFESSLPLTVDCGGASISPLRYSNRLSGGCEISGTVNSTLSAQSPSGPCGGSITESWSFTDNCGRTITQSRIITVSPAPVPTMTPPAAITVACGSIPSASKLLYTNSLTGNCVISGTSNYSTFSASFNSCGDVIETWTSGNDICGRPIASVTRTIHVLTTPVVINCPVDKTVGSCHTQTFINSAFTNWLLTATTSGGCQSGISNNNTGAPLVGGGSTTVIFTVTSSCEPPKTCSATFTVAGILYAAISPTHVSCYGANNGSATAAVIGGTPPYSFLWNPGARTTQTISGLAPGNYTLVVSDADHCSVPSQVVTITQPPILNMTTSKTQPKCFGDKTGIANVSASGGTPPYTFAWNTSPVRTTTLITGLGDGTYTATVTDSKGCTKTASVVIAAPPLLTASIAIPGSFGPNSATVNPVGGTPGYTYVWGATAGGTISQSFIPVVHGTMYSVTVTDSKGCKATASTFYARMAAPVSENAEYPFDAVVYPNPTHGLFALEFNASENQQFKVDVIDFTGRVIMTRSGSTARGPNKFNYDFENLAAGIYFIRIDLEDQSRLLRVVFE